MNPGDWVWNEEHRQLCLLIETQKLWGETVCRVWMPAQETVVSLSAARLKPLAAAAHRKWLERESEKGEYSFAARKRAIARIGLSAVRAHREAQLLDEERAWLEQLKRKRSFSPEMSALILVRIGAGNL